MRKVIYPAPGKANIGMIRRSSIAVFAVIVVACMAAVITGVSMASASSTRSAASISPPQNFPAAKKASFEAAEKLRERAEGRPLTKPDTAAGNAGSNRPGIIPLTHGGRFNSSQFLGTNLWNGQVGSQWEVIQAGGVPTDPSLGAASPTKAGLYVYTRPPDPGSTAAPVFTGIFSPPQAPAVNSRSQMSPGRC